MIIKLLKNKEKGYVAFFITILILSIMLGIAFSIVILTLNAQKISANIIKSSQAYYAAEAGIEDGLLRFFDPDIAYSSSNTFSVAGATVTTSIDKISTSLTIESKGDSSNRIRKVKVEAHVSSSEVSFYYGVQVGDGGLTMMGNSKIFGNIYSNGSVLGASNTELYGDLYVAGNTGIIDNMDIIKADIDDGNAHAHYIYNSTIENGAYYQVIDFPVTTAAAYYPDSPDPEPQELPISQEQIDNWHDDALAGGTSGDYILDGEQDSLGPIKINGNVTIKSNSFLTVTGTIWVTGDFILNSNTVIELDDGYGSSSGVIVVEGEISLDSNVVICGSEGYKSSGNTCYDNEGSFLMFVSTSSSDAPTSPAIWANSNTDAAILYTNSGLIRLGASAQLKEVTGYKLLIDSNAVVIYESGLANLNFTSGPAGGWEIISWQEIE
jgi:hypothetical protein